MSLHLQSTVKLNNGIKMPWLGLGVFKLEQNEDSTNLIRQAIEFGYRHIDTAALYQNEASVGEAIRTCGINREEIFVTSKVWNDNQGYESTLQAFDNSLKKLGFDYLDLYLIHWPVPKQGKYVETWRALEKLYRAGYVKAIGVSNFHISHLTDILRESEVVPAVNQVEFHPALTQVELHDFCKEKEIQLEAWSPLQRGKIFDHPVIQQLSQQYGKTPAQIVLRWDLQKEVVTIPKSAHIDRVKSNTHIFNFELSEADIIKIDQLNRNERIGPDPDQL